MSSVEFALIHIYAPTYITLEVLFQWRERSKQFTLLTGRVEDANKSIWTWKLQSNGVLFNYSN